MSYRWGMTRPYPGLSREFERPIVVVRADGGQVAWVVGTAESPRRSVPSGSLVLEQEPALA